MHVECRYAQMPAGGKHGDVSETGPRLSVLTG